MQSKLFTAALALVTLSTASSAFAGDNWSLFRRSDRYTAPVYKPEPRYQPADYSTTQSYEKDDTYRPVRKPRRDGY